MAKLKIISLYTGAGGLDYGFEAAGFDTAVAVEMDPHACTTLRHNRPWPVLERSIHDVPSEEILEVARLRRGEATALIGGPPCQPFSKSGYWAKGDSGRLQDPRARTLEAYLRVLEDTLPQVFLLENVQGLAYSGKDEGLRYLLDELAEINRRTGSNYRASVKVLNAASYGVPQIRERVFVIGSREGLQFEFPRPTHAPPDPDGGLGLSSGLEPYRTAWDALGDVTAAPNEELEAKGKWAGLLPSIPEGENYLWHTDRGGGLPLFGWRRRYWNFLLKLSKDRPSWTVQAQPGPAVGPFHWENRRLSMRELCRIQTFPDDVVIQGGRNAVQKQVGNAVASLLAEVLGRSIRTQLLGLRKPRGGLKLLPPRREPVPPAEPLYPVPERYRSLVGEHSPHPGTGKGTRASGQRTYVDAKAVAQHD